MGAREGDFKCVANRRECKALWAELLGMTLFVFVGVGSAHQQFRAQFDSGGAEVSLLTISFAFGLGITCFVCMTAGVSGGHLNPAVTFCLMALQEISVPLGFLYIFFQMVGACIGALVAALADPYLAGFAVNNVVAYTCGDWHGSLGDTVECCQRFDCNVTGGFMLENVSTEEYWTQLSLVPTNEAHFQTNTRMWGPAFVVEFVGTFMLCLTVLMTAVYKDSVAGNLAPLAIGLSVFFAHLIAIPITNCSINPARSFGAAVIASILPFYDSDGQINERIVNAWEQMVFFWAVPIAGGLLAALVFYFGFLEENNDEGKRAGWDLNPLEEQRGDGQKTASRQRRSLRPETELTPRHRKKDDAAEEQQVDVVVQDTGAEEAGEPLKTE